MQALTSLGINGKMLIAQIINFLVLLFILTKLLYKPMLKLLDERRLKIEKGLADAEAAAKSLATAEEEAEKIRRNAYTEANIILNDAKTEAKQSASEIVADAHREAEKIVRRGSDEAISLKDSALREAKNQVGELISLALGKIVNDQIDQATRDKLSQQAIKELQ